MKRIITFILFLFPVILYAQTSPDYIFGNDMGNSWSWTTGTQGTTSLGNSFKWQFQANADGSQYFKFGETSSNANGQGFWMVGSGGDVQYPGGGNWGEMWAAIYHPNMNDAGAFYFAVTNANYYIIKSRKQSGSDADFAVFDNGNQAPVNITSISQTFSGSNLLVDVTLSDAKSSVEKVWVRYIKYDRPGERTGKWQTSSTTVEASQDMGGNTWRATISVSSGETIVEYYVFTTINLTSAPAESDADFYTINYDNANGQNYRVLISESYYIGSSGTAPGGSEPNFSSLREAVDFLNTVTFIRSSTFYFTSNLTESQNSFLGVNTSGYTLTFRPYYEQQTVITFTKTTDNASSSGGLVIGLSSDNWTSLITTENIIINGYTDVGSTIRLTLETSSSAFTAHTPIHIIGDVNNVTIKNCSLKVNQTTGTSSFGAVSLRSGKWSSINYIPDNIIVDNCIINTNTPSGAGIFVTFTTSGGGATPDQRPTGLEFKNNTIIVKHRGISLNYSGTCSIYNNEIKVNQPASGYASFGIGGTSSGLVLTNVYRNKIIELGTGNTGGGSNGIRGIQAFGGGTWNIYNNFITGFSTPSTGTTEVVGIRVSSSSNIYYNTIVVNNVNTTGSGTTPTSGIVTYTTSCNIVNNIIITEEDNFVNYCIYASSLPSTSDYNVLYRSGTTNAKIGFYTTDRATLNEWQSATSKDANSVSKNVTFVSSTDLHLNSSVHSGDVDLVATPLSGYTTDIDGDTRDNTYPYKGADELAVPAPVQLVSFNAFYNGNSVKLTWTTSTEIQNYGWEVERAEMNKETNKPSVWQKIGFVKGAGNSNSPNQYEFIDNSVLFGNYFYRLKQIDIDGSTTYSSEVKIFVGQKPQVYDVKNFPNPFNPSTTIRYELPESGNIKLSIYDITGQLVKTLVDDYRDAGIYEVLFDGSQLASGIYISVLQGNGFKVVRKMQLIK